METLNIGKCWATQFKYIKFKEDAHQSLGGN